MLVETLMSTLAGMEDTGIYGPGLSQAASRRRVVLLFGTPITELLSTAFKFR